MNNIYLIGERTGGETPSNGGGASVGAELQHGPLAERPRGDGEHLRGVLDGSDGAGGQ